MRRVLFLMALALAGCGKSTPPTTPPTVPAPVIPNVTTTPPTTKLPPSDPYQLDPENHVFPVIAADGRLVGKNFKPETVLFRGNMLTFRTGKELIPDQEIVVQLQTAADQSILPIRVVVNAIKPNVGGELAVVTVSRRVDKDGLPVETKYADKYSMTLELAARKEGKVKGQIYLCLPDQEKSFLAGTFEAVWQRPFGAPLDADEVPYLQGSVPIPEKSETVRLGFVGESAMNEVMQCTAVFNLKQAPEGTRTGHSSGELTGRGDIVAYQEKGVLKFETSRLMPGRYIIWAQSVQGAIAFDWVDVAANSTLTTKLEFPKETGGIEARVPENFQGKIDVTPVDPKVTDPKKEFAPGRYNPVQSEAVVDKGKASVLNLQPGKYRFRLWKKLNDTEWSGGEAFFVDVKAGAPAIVNVEPKK